MTKYLLSFLAFTSIFRSSFSIAQNKDSYTAGARVAEVMAYVNRYYVDTVDDNQLANDAIVTMLRDLDPHSAYIPKEEVEEANQQIDGNFVGVGIRFNILDDTLMVVATIPGGPSEKLGVLPGDKIITVDGKNIAGIGLKNSDVRDYLMGDLDSKVSIEIQRKGNAKPIQFDIKREKIPLNSVISKYMVNETIGYIKLTSFSRSTYDEVSTAIKELKKQGMTSLIFDLKDNGGGLLSMAKEVADEYLSNDKLIVYSEGRVQPRSDLVADKAGDFEKGRLIILTNENTASASEIVSGSIQDWDRGLIVGRRTFGKGLVQRPFPLSDGAQMRLTIARYYTPTGRWIQKPYDDAEAYAKDQLTRYLHGEYMHKDSIKLPDSLLYKTKIKQREVYGGGGIMPDVFVPLDTTGVNTYFKDLVRTGALYQYAVEYVNDNRKKLEKRFPTFNSFQPVIGHLYTELEADFLTYLSKHHPDVKMDSTQYKECYPLVSNRMEAFIAQVFWDYSAFYQIFNRKDEIVQKAIQLLQTNEYDKMNLAQ